MARFERYEKYLVLKHEDIDKYLSEAGREELARLCCHIRDGREKDGKYPAPSYVVVNEDEPYAEKVWRLVQEQQERTTPT